MPQHTLPLDAELDGAAIPVPQVQPPPLPLGPEPGGVVGGMEYLPLPGLPGHFPGQLAQVVAAPNQNQVFVVKPSGWAKQWPFAAKVWFLPELTFIRFELVAGAVLVTDNTTASFHIVRARLVLSALAGDASPSMIQTYREVVEALMQVNVFIDTIPFGTLLTVGTTLTVETSGRGPVCLEAKRSEELDLIALLREKQVKHVGTEIGLPPQCRIHVFLTEPEAGELNTESPVPTDNRRAENDAFLLRHVPPNLVFPGRLLLIGLKTTNLGAINIGAEGPAVFAPPAPPAPLALEPAGVP